MGHLIPAGTGFHTNRGIDLEETVDVVPAPAAKETEEPAEEPFSA